MRFTSKPRSEHRPGSQSTTVTCTGARVSGWLRGALACAERMQASRKSQLARVNCGV
jgi:hypothetical protein